MMSLLRTHPYHPSVFVTTTRFKFQSAHQGEVQRVLYKRMCNTLQKNYLSFLNYTGRNSDNMWE